MRPTDLDTLVSVSAPAMSPDGTRVVFTTRRPDLSADAYTSQLWLLDVETGEHRRITRGRSDSAPRFSPDAQLIAFLRPGGESGAPQLHVMDARGGEPVRVTDLHGGVSSFAFSPDGDRFVFTSSVVEHGRGGTVKDVSAAAEAPRLITKPRYRMNGAGFTVDRVSQVFMVDVPSVDAEPYLAPLEWVTPEEHRGIEEPTPEFAEPEQLTHGLENHHGAVFTADGSSILAIAQDGATADDELTNQIVAINPGGKHRRTVVVPASKKLSIWQLSPTADGGIFFTAQQMGRSGRDFVGRNAQVFHLAPGAKTPTELTEAESFGVHGLFAVNTRGSRAFASDDEALVTIEARGAATLARVSRDGGLTTLVSGELEVQAAASNGERTIVSYSSPTTFGDLALVEDDGSLRPLTDFSAALRSSGLVMPEELTVIGRDGYPVHGWVFTPPTPAKRKGGHPVLLSIHGGPFSAYTWSVFDEAQVYAAAGYAVVLCNPRGSSGYGQSHGRATRYHWGELDFHDVIDFFEGALEAHDDFDAKRTGVMGGSYGGYLTAWVTSHDHRFTAAIVERGFLDPFSFFGTSDIGRYFGTEYLGEDAQRLTEMSPLAHAADVETPTFIIHSDEDLRCPLSQAEMYYAALQRAGVETQLMIFPSENHELSRSGRPRHRLQRFQAILAWWREKLPA